MWTDIHAHLYDLTDSDLLSVSDRASQSSVSTIINTATSLSTCTQVLKQQKLLSNHFCALGISPFEVTGYIPPDWIDTLGSLCRSSGVIAIGEIGLDNSNPRYPSIELQLPVFQQQLELARTLDLPAIIHSRGAEREALDMCLAAGIRSALFHCFTGSVAVLEKILEAGYFISISGIATFSSTLSHVVEATPLNRMFLESDSPYLAPVPMRGKQNEPAWITYTAQAVANIKKVNLEILSSVLDENFSTLFNHSQKTRST